MRTSHSGREVAKNGMTRKKHQENASAKQRALRMEAVTEVNVPDTPSKSFPSAQFEVKLCF